MRVLSSLVAWGGRGVASEGGVEFCLAREKGRQRVYHIIHARVVG